MKSSTHCGRSTADSLEHQNGGRLQISCLTTAHVRFSAKAPGHVPPWSNPGAAGSRGATALCRGTLGCRNPAREVRLRQEGFGALDRSRSRGT